MLRIAARLLGEPLYKLANFNVLVNSFLARVITLSKKTNENRKPKSIEYSCFFRFMKFRLFRFDFDVFLAISIL
jgi:hypothetical protein